MYICNTIKRNNQKFKKMRIKITEGDKVIDITFETNKEITNIFYQICDLIDGNIVELKRKNISE